MSVLIPRRKGDTPNPRGGIRGVITTLYKKGILDNKEFISQFNWNVRKTGNSYGGHDRTTSLKETPTKYTVQALTYMVFDLILWFKETVDKLKEK